VPAPDPNAPGELTGGFPTLPVPPAALVTGGARRIGRALVLALAAIRSVETRRPVRVDEIKP